MICLVDYGMGNLRSVEKALERIGARVQRSSDPSLIQDAKAIVVPGVGSFDHAVDELKQRQLFKPIVEAIHAGKPYLGLCLGLQLLFSRSEEGRREGFGILPGKVTAFPGSLKTPHMGWNEVEWTEQVPGQSEGSRASYYFVHSYYVEPENSDVVAGWTTYGVRFASVIRHQNIVATQFHPEKSQANGLSFLRNYVTGLEKL